MKHIIFIVCAFFLTLFVHAIDSAQLIRDLTELQENNSDFMKEKSLSLQGVFSSSLSHQKFDEVIQSILKHFPSIFFTTKFSLNKDDLAPGKNLHVNGNQTKLW